MKKIIVLTTILVSIGLSGCATHYQNVHDIPFTDPNFKACVLKQGLTNTDQFRQITCENKNIHSADGVNNFRHLEKLDLSGNQLTHLDVSDIDALKILSVEENALTSLDVSDNSKLAVLNASNNPLNELDMGFWHVIPYVNVGDTHLHHVRHNDKITTLIVK